MNNNLIIGFVTGEGYESVRTINDTTLEGLNYGFLDIHDVADMSYLIEEFELSEDDYIDNWYIALDNEQLKELYKHYKGLNDFSDFIEDLELYLYDYIQGLETSEDIYNKCLKMINN